MGQVGAAESEISYGTRLTQLAGERGDAADLVLARTDGSEVMVSWNELEGRANQIARYLAERGVEEGGIVAIALPSCVEHVLATFATWKLGATVLPLRSDLPDWEVDRLLGLAGAAAVISDHPLSTTAAVTLDDLTATAEREDGPLPDRTSECTGMIATSGSTGRPKLIVVPARGVLGGDQQTRLIATAEPPATLITSPLYHVNGFAFAAPGLLEGGRVVLMERFDAERAVELIERHRITYLVMVPTMLQRIARLPDVDPQQFTSIQRVIYGGSTIPEWVVDRWLELVAPERFVFTYGMSERIGLVSMTGADWADHRGSTGRPVDNELRILDDTGNEVPDGQVGEIFMRPLDGPPRFRYIGSAMPTPTADGFHSVGDMGWVADGYLSIADRRQDMIISGGANVFPAEVESVLSEHPDVVDQVVIGLPDAEWGRQVHAIIQPADGAVPPSADELRDHCRQRLAAYKVPKSFEVIDRVPRTAAGKINRTVLADERGEEPDR